METTETISDLKIFPTDLEYLILAAYASQSGTGVVPGQSHIKIDTIPLFQDDDFLRVGMQEIFNAYDINDFMKNWRVLDVADDEQTGYLGVILQNETDRQLVLAHRSTNFAGGAYNLFKGSGTQCDVEGVLMCGITLYQRWGYVMTAKAVDYARKLRTKDDKQYSLSFTGHSLGAWMTDLSVYYCHVDFGYTNVKAVTFDGPGSWEMIERLHASSIKGIEAENFKEFDLDITAYFSAPNIVNCTNTHVGSAYCLFPEIEKPEFLEHLEKLKKFFSPPNNTVDAILSTLGHGLEYFIPQFDLETGKPKPGQSMRISKWPKIVYEGKKIELKEEEALAFIDATKGSVKSTTSTSYPRQIFSVFSLGVGKIFTNLADYAVGALTDRDTDNTFFKALFSSDNNGTSTISATFSLLGSFLNDEIKLSQFWIAHSKLKREDGYRSNIQSLDDEFVLSEIGGYNVYDQDNNTRRITDTIDGYLSDIKDKEDLLAISQTCEKFRKIAKSALDKYEKRRDRKGNSLCILEQHKGTCNITRLRDQMRGILRDYDKELFNFLNMKVPKATLELNSHLERLLRSSNVINEVSRVKKYFTQELVDKKVIVIQGNQQFGKTVLLKQYAADLIQEKNIIVWPFNCESSSSLDSDYRFYANDIQLKIEGKDAVHISNNVHSRIKDKSEMLFLFDNVYDRKTIDPFVSTLPTNVKLVITTKNYAMILPESWGTIQLSAFTEEEAAELITSNLPYITEEEISLILKESQMLPQELSLLISVFLQKREPVQKVLEEIQKENNSVYRGFYKNLFTTLMTNETEVYHLLKYLAWLNHMDMPVEFLEQLGTWTNIQSLLAILEKYFLISHMGNGHYQMSRDIQSLVREFQPSWDYITQLLNLFDTDKFPLLTKSNKKISNYVNASYQHLRSIVDILFQYEEYKMFNEILVRHTLKLAKLYQYGLGLLDESHRYYSKLWNLLDVTIEEMTIEQLEYIDDAVEYTYLLLDLQKYEEAEKIALNLNIISENNRAEIAKYFEGKRFDLSDVSGLCGDVEYNLEKFKVAKMCYEKAFIEYKGKYGVAPTLRLAELAFLRGKAYVKCGKLAEGKQAYMEAYALMNQIPRAKEEYLYSDLLCNLGIIQCKTNEFQKMDNYFEEAIRISHALLGPKKNPNLVAYQVNYGNYLRDNRKFELALKVLNNALSISKEIRGIKNKTIIAEINYSIGKTYQSQEIPNYEEAMKAYNNCLEMGIKLNIPKYQALGISAIGEIQLARGLITDSIISLEKAISMKLDNYNILKNYLSDDYKNLACAYGNEVYNDQGKNEELRKLSNLRSLNHDCHIDIIDEVFADNPVTQTRALLSHLECSSSKILRIKKMIQKDILNPMQIYAKEGKWQITGCLQYFQWDISDLISLKFLQDYLKEEEELTLGLMLCFEAINLGIMKANFQNIQFSLDFLNMFKSKNLKREILRCHPEFFVDGMILDFVLSNDSDSDLEPHLKKKLMLSPLLQFTITNSTDGKISVVMKDEDDLRKEMRDKFKKMLKKK